MRHFFLILLFALAVVAGSPAFAGDPSATVFPPASCSRSEQRVITWQDGTTTTMCATGQQVMNLAIPTCYEEQHVVMEGGQFICKTVAAPPACGANEFLTFDGSEYTCGSTNVPTCGADQVLTFDGSGFICVNRTDEIPTCGTDEFLTYNGLSFQCAVTKQISIPSCGDGEVLTSSGGQLVCVSVSTGSRSCQSNVYTYNGWWYRDMVAYEAFPGTGYSVCWNGNLATSCWGYGYASHAYNKTYQHGAIAKQQLNVSFSDGGIVWGVDDFDYLPGSGDGSLVTIQCVDGSWQVK